MKKVLFVYPHNFVDRDMGTNNRVYQVARYLKQMGCTIDLYACQNFVSTSYDRLRKIDDEEIVNNLFLYDFNHTRKYVQEKKESGETIVELDDWVTPEMRRQFSEIMQNGYDYIVMFYVYTAELLSDPDIKAKKIYFMEDFLSVGHFVSGMSSELGSYLDSEMCRLRYFDEIICISYDEKTFFEKVLSGKKLYFLPHLIEGKEINRNSEKIYDLLFIGYDNNYNIRGMKWFFENVYPYLDKKLKILIAGKVVSTIKDEYENVTKISYVQDLSELYSKVNIAMCPLLNGTGMKIKVIEAMSYGIPVVCTSRGVDGFPDKYENGCLVTDDPYQFAMYINQLFTDRHFYMEVADRTVGYFKRYLDQRANQTVLKTIFDLSIERDCLTIKSFYKEDC